MNVGRIFNALCIVAWFVNIGLNIFGHISNNFDLQLLSLGNMLLLSFVLIREPKSKAE